MATYVVCGDRTVAGRTQTEQLTDNDLEGVNIDALVNGGHIKPVVPAKKATTSKKEAD